MGKDFIERIDLSEKDVFKRWRQIALIKIELINKYPDIFNFILTASLEDAAEVKKDLDTRNKEFINRNLQRVLDDIDFSLFKPGIDTKGAIEIIVWTIEGFTAKEQEKANCNSKREFDYDQILTDLNGYLNLLKGCFYR